MVVLRARARAEAARRRHQPAPARRARAHRAGPGRQGRRDRRAARTPVVRQPLRPARLERAPRSRRGYRWPQLSVHRGEFQLLLAREVEARLGGSIRLGQRFDGVEHRGDTEIARFTDAAGRESAVEADLVVGADGIHSALRRQWYPDEGAPPWNGLVLWRGPRSSEFLDGRTMFMAGDGEQKFVAYPLVAPGPTGDEPHQLHRRAARARGRRRDRRLEPPGGRGAHHRALRRLAVRLARRAGVIAAPTRSSSTPWSTAIPLPRWTSGGPP